MGITKPVLCTILGAASGILLCAESDLVELEAFAVEESQRAHLDTLNPTDRTISGAFFDGMSPLEIPRSVLQLSPKALTLFQVENFGDLDKVGAGTERYNFYGVAGAPVIRGWQGSAYYNGMLRAYQRNEMPTSFGSLEAIDVVKGPAPAQLVPSHVGGFANMIPKSPYFDQARGSVTAQWGSNSYYKGQVDYGAPVMLGGAMPAALRLSVTVQDAGSYYHAVQNNFISVYGALKVQINDQLRLFTGGEFFDFRSNENVGWNRPTQNLIDRGQYVLGQPLSLVRPLTGGRADRDLIGDFTAIPSDRRPLFRALVVPTDLVDQAVSAGDLSPAQRDLLLNVGDPAVRADLYAGLPDDIERTQSGYVYTPGYFLAGGSVFTAPIDGRTVLSDQNDFADSRDFLWFADLEGQPSGGFSWKNQLFVESLTTDKTSSHGYAFVSEQHVIDDRLALTHHWIGEDLSAKIQYGAQLRYSEALQLQDFWSEPFARRDLLNPDSPNGKILSGAAVSPSSGLIYWRGGFNASGPGGHAVRSRNLQSALFAVGEISWQDRLSLLVGLRGERADFAARAPEEGGYSPSEANAVEGDLSYLNWSLQPIWTINEQMSVYAAFQESTSFHPTQAGAILGEENFGAAELKEVGAKAALLEGRLFASLAAYKWRQERFSDRTSISQPFAAEGWEFEAVWQPTDEWSFITSYGDRSIRKLSPLGFRTVPYSAADPTGAGDPEVGIALQAGQLFSSISSAARAAYADADEIAHPPANPHLIQGGAPERTAKLMVVYENPEGWGFAAGPRWRSGFWHNYDRTLWIHEVVLWNVQVFLGWNQWTLRLNVENLTDERYFIGAEPEFGANTLISRGTGREFRLTVKRDF